MDNKILIIGGNKFATSFAEYAQIQSVQVTQYFLDTSLPSENNYALIAIFESINSLSDTEIISWLPTQSHKGTCITVNLIDEELTTVQNKLGIAVLGMNVSFPSKSSPFMEIIRNKNNQEEQVESLMGWGRNVLNLDPYTCVNISIKSYLTAAMLREAFFLVDNEYADVESIDRACRNDAGYYLPFTGNFLYMDLMGTLAYALVMKDLNPELSTATDGPEWLHDKIEKGELGMKQGKGFYNYSTEDLENWDSIVKEYSVEIRALIEKYKKNYQ